MTEEELKLYLNQQELKIEQKVKEKNDELSTFFKKRKRTKEKNPANNTEEREENNIPVLDINIKKKDNKNKNNVKVWGSAILKVFNFGQGSSPTPIFVVIL